MKAKTFLQFDPARVPSPCFVVDEIAIENNLRILDRVQRASGVKILMALKAFSMFSLAPLISRYLKGTCASGLHEAKLGSEEYGGETHVFSAAYKEHELSELVQFADHVVFNSFNQWHRFQPLLMQARQQRPELSFGLRVNPLHSEGTTPIYDPCSPGSRLGIPYPEFANENLEGVSGLHFHTLCEQGFEPLNRTLEVIEKHFTNSFSHLDWVNFGGGHHITHQDYAVDALIERVIEFQNRHNVQVYLEPGEAIAIHSGVLVSEVLDLKNNQMDLAILDCSATCHMPDTIEMPYRADIFSAGESGEKQHTYRLGGQTCLAGDVMGDYSFDKPLEIGQRLMFDDMSHYTMVKTSTFNGINLPSIAIWNSATDEVRLVKQFCYQDFKKRLS